MAAKKILVLSLFTIAFSSYASVLYESPVLDTTLNLEVLTDECTCEREYIFGNEKVSFNDSIILCWQLGMELATPTTEEEERAFISAYRNSHSFGFENAVWLGAQSCSSCATEYLWILTGTPIVYTDFVANSPGINASYAENCLVLIGEAEDAENNVYGWYDVDCQGSYNIACQTRCCCSN